MDADWKKTILVISHGHPDFSPGGGEIAAYSLFSGYAKHPEVKKAFFLARVGGGKYVGGISRHAENEYLWDQGHGNDFYMEGGNLRATINILPDFLRSINPDIAHLHHAVHMGYEMLEVIRRALPDAKIYFTLHEYLPICHNSGQMLKTDGSLCRKSGPRACQECFPGKTEADFWLRKQRFLHFFKHVDGFFAPSEFLRQRYIEWGLQPEKIHVIENGLREIGQCQPRALHGDETRNRFGFFGQITQFKGLEPLFQAINLMRPAERARIVLEIHGAGFGIMAEAHEKMLRRKYKKLADEGVARWIGAYDSSQIASRMAGIDWVVIPSIWWENSPVVIQEAFACGRPPLVSNIGGMREKVENGVNGIHVEAGNPQAWADAMLECAGNNDLWEKLRLGMRKCMGIDECAEAHLGLMK